MRLRGTCRIATAANRRQNGSAGATVLLTTCVVFSGLQTAFAQGSYTPTRPSATRVSYTPDETRGIINDLSNGFMDDFSRRQLPSGSSSVTAPTNEIRKLRPLIREFADEMQQLVYELTDEMRSLPTLRPILTDALKVSALAVGLDRAMQTINDHRLVLRDIQELDVAWRELDYRLASVRGLSRPTQDRIASLKLIEDDINKSIGVAPQFNRQALFEATYNLAQDLRTLISDVQVELGPRDSQSVLLNLNRARQQVLNLSSLLEQNNVDSQLIVDEYRRFQTLWNPEQMKLQAFNNLYLERSIRRIMQTDGEIHQLLLLPNQVDRQQLTYLASSLKRDIDNFFDRTSLKLLMNMPQANRVAGVASEFYGVCEHFVSEVQSNARHEQLVDSFRYIEEAQRHFSDVFYNIPSNDALAALQQIEQTIATMSSALRVQRDSFDRRSAIELVARVESEIMQLESATMRWLSVDRQQFANACLQSVRTLRQQTQQLSQDLVRGANTQQLRVRTEELYDTWRTVYNYLVRCQTSDRTNLGRISSRITPALVELRTMLTL